MTSTDGADPTLGSGTQPRRLTWIWIGAIAWAVIGSVIAWRAIGDVNADAKPWVGLATTILPLSAVAAALLVKRCRNLGVAGLLLFLSIGTPTYEAYIVNVLPIILIVGLVAARPKDRSKRASSNGPMTT
jgi:uncharacterized membrane protein YhaH (DUF805 family)